MNEIKFIPDSIEVQDYVLLKKIGHGSFGEVFIIEEKENKKQKFAAKILFKDYNESKKTLSRLRSEVTILSKISHPAILRYIGFNKFGFHRDKRPVIVTEFLENGSLDRILRLGRQGKPLRFWTNTKKLICIYGIASAMAYLHKNGIIHCDLKPGNILIDGHLLPKIGDFGLSEILTQNDEQTIPQSSIYFKGTFAYSPPEAILTYEFHKPGDVYAFGLIVYGILTNNEPFINQTNQEILQNATNGIHPFLNEIKSDRFKKLIDECLSQDPNKRPSFDKIIDQLEKDEDFLFDDVIKEEYLNYINYVKKPENMKNPFEKVSIEDLIQDIDCDDAFKEVFLEDLNNKEFKELPFETQNMINDIVKKDDISLNKITFDPTQLETLYTNKSLNSPIFINILNYFDEIQFTMNYPSENYDEIMATLSEIKKKNIERMIISINVLNIKKINNEFINNKFINDIIIGEEVVEIENEAFRGSDELKKVIINGPVETIGKSMFRGCANLVEVKLSYATKLIGKHVFRGCHNIKEIVIPDSVTDIEKSVFRGCFKLASVTLSNKMDRIQKSTFRGCYALNDFIILPTIKVIESKAFEKCSSLTEISIPPGTELQKQAFRGCSSLNKIIIDPYKSKIANDAFQECSDLWILSISTSNDKITPFDMTPFPNIKRIEIPNNVTSIENKAFLNCSSLIEISIPDSVHYIGQSAFEGCSSLIQIFIPSSVRTIDSKAFKNCFALEKISFDPYKTTVSDDSFVDCKSLNKLRIATRETEIHPFNMNPFPNKVTLELPKNIISIDLSGNDNINSIVFFESPLNDNNNQLPDLPYINSTYHSTIGT